MRETIVKNQGNQMVELEEMFSKIQKRLELDNESREELIKLGRVSIRNSSLAIRHLHRKEMETASKIIEENVVLIARINDLAKNMNPSPFGMILSCNQEYAESVFLLSFLQEKSFPNYSLRVILSL